MDQQQLSSQPQEVAESPAMADRSVSAEPPATIDAPADEASGSNVPSPQVPLMRHHVHHSYIWLQCLRTVIVVLVVVALFSGAIVTILSNAATAGSINGRSLLTVLIFSYAIVAFVAIAIFVIIYRVFAYLHLYYELGPEEFNLYKGILNKKRIHVPYRRIQTIDQHSSLSQRILGVCTILIDTAGGARNKAIVVPYMQKSRAEELRRELFARKQYQLAKIQQDVLVQKTLAQQATNPAGQETSVQGVLAKQAQDSTSALSTRTPTSSIPGNAFDAPAEIWKEMRGVFGGTEVDTGRTTYEYGLSNKELIFTGFLNNTAFITLFLGLLALIVRRGILLMSFGPEAFEYGSFLFGDNVLIMVIAILFVIALVIWLVTAIGTCITYGGFRARRRDNRIEIEHGLLQHRVQGVDVDRVQSIVVRQTVVHRLLGYCVLSVSKVDTNENYSEERNRFTLRGMIIHPFVKLNRVPEILAGMIPEFADVPVDTLPVAKPAMRRAIIRRGFLQNFWFWLAIVLSRVQMVIDTLAYFSVLENADLVSTVDVAFPVLYLLCLVLTVLRIIGAVLWARGSGFAYNQQFMQVSNSGFARETVSFPRQKIQFGYTKTNPLQRHAHTATIYARTAAGIGGTSVRLIDTNEEDAEAWLSWLEPRKVPQG